MEILSRVGKKSPKIVKKGEGIGTRILPVNNFVENFSEFLSSIARFQSRENRMRWYSCRLK